MSGTVRGRRRRQAWFGLKRPVKRVIAFPVVNPVARTIVRRRMGREAADRLPAPVSVRTVKGQVDDITFTMNDPAQCIIAKELHWGGGRRPRPQDQFALEVFARLARGADRILDIGSYTGVFSLVAARANPRARVDAFEIVPSNFLACWGNVITNDLVGGVEVHLCGVGEPGSIRVPAATGGSALPDFWSVEDQSEGSDGIEVPVVGLADALALARVDPRAPEQHEDGRQESGRRLLVKVDVEGHEAALVTFGRNAITAHGPTFLMEILPGADVSPLIDVFGATGYHYYLVAEDRLHFSERPHGVADYRDWVISRLEPAHLEDVGIPVAG